MDRGDTQVSKVGAWVSLSLPAGVDLDLSHADVHGVGPMTEVEYDLLEEHRKTVVAIRGFFVPVPESAGFSINSIQRRRLALNRESRRECNARWMCVCQGQALGDHWPCACEGGWCDH